MDTSCSLGLGHHQYFITVLDAVGVESPGVVPHFLRTEGAALVDVIEPHAVGGQLDHRCQLLLQLSYCLVQTDVQLTQRQTVSTLRKLIHFTKNKYKNRINQSLEQSLHMVALRRMADFSQSIIHLNVHSLFLKMN